ncbi:MAG: FlgD immunoglobulin-like domain containing protein [Candidatus Neomarinimicrobiota bacterium]
MASDTAGVIGAYQTTCQQLGLDNSNELKNYTILQNYPNPFNPLTDIMYTLDEYGEFSLHIYDIRGNLVKKLKTGRGSPGSYKLAWNSKDESGKKVTSGVYICQLKTIQKVHNSRMLLLK